MKTAKMAITVIELICPSCNEHLETESGSHMFPIYEIPDEIECSFCSEWLNVPANAKKLRDGKARQNKRSVK